MKRKGLTSNLIGLMSGIFALAWSLLRLAWLLVSLPFRLLAWIVRLAAGYTNVRGPREISPEMRARVLNRDQSICRYCGRRAQTLDIDHVIPVCQGGDSGLDNLVTACQRCNRRKAGKTPAQARMRLLKPRTVRK